MYVSLFKQIALSVLVPLRGICFCKNKTTWILETLLCTLFCGERERETGRQRERDTERKKERESKKQTRDRLTD